MDCVENMPNCVVTDFNTSKVTEKRQKTLLKRQQTMIKGTPPTNLSPI